MKTIHIVAETIPEAFEKAMVETWENGARFKTQYDQEEREDPLSRDVTAMIHITDPMKEPRIHRGIPMGLNDLERYRNEILYGVHDYYMDDTSNPDRWTYTYSARLFNYDVLTAVPSNVTDVIFPSIENFRLERINQIERCIKQLKECGYSRRIIAVTYQTWKDANCGDPPCLQFLQFRTEQTSDGPKLNMQVFMRSNDAYKAFFSNAFAFTELQKMVADRVGVDVGSCVHTATSFHIYGSYFEEFKGFLNTIKNRSFEDRVFDSNSTLTTELFIDGCNELLSEEKMPEDKKQLIRERKLYLESLL